MDLLTFIFLVLVLMVVDDKIDKTYFTKDRTEPKTKAPNKRPETKEDVEVISD